MKWGIFGLYHIFTKSVSLLAFLARRFFLRFHFESVSFVNERCNTRISKNEISSHLQVYM